jgi:hypothetical protein
MKRNTIAILVLALSLLSSTALADVGWENFDARLRFGRALDFGRPGNVAMYLEGQSILTNYQALDYKIGLQWFAGPATTVHVYAGQVLTNGSSLNNFLLGARLKQGLGWIVDLTLEADLIIPMVKDVQIIHFRTYEALDFYAFDRDDMFFSLATEQENMDGVKIRVGPSFTYQFFRIWAGYMYNQEAAKHRSATNPPRKTPGATHQCECNCGDYFFVSAQFSF